MILSQQCPGDFCSIFGRLLVRKRYLSLMAIEIIQDLFIKRYFWSVNAFYFSSREEVLEKLGNSKCQEKNTKISCFSVS